MPKTTATLRLTAADVASLYRCQLMAEQTFTHPMCSFRGLAGVSTQTQQEVKRHSCQILRHALLINARYAS